MIDANLSKQILNKIFASKEFASSKTDQDFLSYLVYSSIKGQIPKEITIAIDVFGKNSDFNPSIDSTVRTHIYTLRKKLETYYLTDGKDDKVRFVIPKGQYGVEFVSIHDHKPFKKILQRFYLLPALLVVFFAVISVYFWQKSVSLERQIKELKWVEKDNPIWSEFLQSDLNTIIVIGDYYVFQERYEKTGRECFIRDVEINSPEDIANFLIDFPEMKKSINETVLTYLGKEIPWSLQHLFSVFRRLEKKIKLKLASELLWEDVQENNIIFVGHFKTLKIMSHFFNNLRYKVELFPHEIHYMPNYTDTLETISLNSYYRYGFHNDYAIVAKFPGGNNNTIMMFTSFSSFGKIESVKTLTDPQFPQKVLDSQANKFEKMPPYFEVLFRVYGVEKTGFPTEILHFDEIDPNMIID